MTNSSRNTPRKSRHRHQPSGGGARAVLASDYESDVPYHGDPHDILPPSKPTYDTNTELNLSVLRRYIPDLRSIVSIAANAVIYTFSATAANWEKSGTEGTLFVCDLEPVVVGGQSLTRACVFILNRRALENTMVDLAKVSYCEWQGEFLIFQLETAVEVSGSGEGGDDSHQVIGVWMHAAEGEDTREVNSTIIQGLWHEVRQGAAAHAAALDNTVSDTGEEEEEEEGGSGVGKSISIQDLFGRKLG